MISVWTQKVHYIPKVQASNIDKKNEWGVILLCEAKRKVSINARTDKFGSSPPPTGNTEKTYVTNMNGQLKVSENNGYGTKFPIYTVVYWYGEIYPPQGVSCTYLL